MTALAGLCSWNCEGAAPEECRQMLLAQSRYARRAPEVLRLNSAVLGCAFYDLLPEDRYDRQPYADFPSERLLVADCRLDNRSECLDQLRLGPNPTISDAELIFRLWMADGRDDVFRRLRGDFAIALWNGRDRVLTLVRDHTGQRPLFYTVQQGFVAFASMPEGLHALHQVRREVDARQLARFVADIPNASRDSFFKDVFRVEPGHVVRLTPGGPTSRSYWEMPDRELRLGTDEDYLHAFREQLDRATLARLRGSGGIVAAHLSAGVDSSAVTVTAARLEPQSKVVAFTTAPRLGYSGPVPRGRMTDESAVAAETAAMYPNIEHVVLRSDRLSPLASIRAEAASYPEPVGHPCNHTWWSATNQAVHGRGISVLLTGETGNLTISAGGLSILSEFILKGRWMQWWREARASIASGAPSWRGILASSFLPWLPGPAWTVFSRALRIRRGVSGGVSLLRPEWQADIAALAERYGRGGQPDKDPRLARWMTMGTTDPGSFRKVALARWGVDERDPTADSRLAEFMFSLPVEQLYSGGTGRRIVRKALAGRVAPGVLDGRLRGYQYADWHEGIDRAGLLREVARLEAEFGEASPIDLDALQRLATDWPSGDWASPFVITTYRIMLLRALAAAAFAADARQSAVQQR